MKKNIRLGYIFTFIIFLYLPVFPVANNLQQNYEIYIPHTTEQVKNFWKIPFLCLIDEKTKTYSYDICDQYIKYLFFNIKSQDDFNNMILFTKYSDGINAEAFDDYWLVYIKKNYETFRNFFTKIDLKNREHLIGAFRLWFYDMKPEEKARIKKELGIEYWID